MKYQLEENDNEYIERINKNLQNGGYMPLFISEKGSTYYLEFTCVDIAKANAFVANLLAPSTKNTTEIENTLGISVNSINYCHGDGKLNEIKAYLRKTLEDLERI